jgi:TctA family transporter
MTLARGDFLTFAQRPISAGLLVVAIAALVLVLSPAFRRTREVAFQEDQ